MANKTLNVSDKAFRRACAVAVLNGIWASNGKTLLDAEDSEYAAAIRAVSRTAYQMADEMLRRERAEKPARGIV